MTLLRGVISPRASIENPSVPLTGGQLVDFLNMDNRSSSGVNVSETKALGMSAVWRAVSLKAAVAASLPFGAYKSDSTGAPVPYSGQAARLLADPHPDMTPFELWETVYLHRYLWGNAYLRKLKNPLGQIQELWPIHPSRVKVGRLSDTGRKIYAIDGGAEEHTDDTILHIPGMGYDGVCGVSPIRVARQSIGLALAAEEYGAKLFGSGSLATGVLQTEQRLTSEQADALHARWKAKRSGMGSAHETMILDAGAKFTQLTIPPEDAQFLESRQFQINEVSRWFGVPSFLMFDTTKSTSWGTGLEQQAIGWVVYDLRPELVRFEQRVTKMLKPQPVYAKYNVEGLLRGDSAARSEFYTKLWNIGALSTNDIRGLEEQPPVEGGDVRYRPLNMGVLGEADSPPESTLAAPTSTESARLAAALERVGDQLALFPTTTEEVPTHAGS